MAHLLLYGLLAIILAAGLFALAARFLPAGEQIAPSVRDEPPWELPPDRELQPEDVDSVRLPVALRGYRFAETDTLLDRLATELRARDYEIARLRGHAPVVEGDGSAAEGDVPATEAGPMAGPDGAPTPYTSPPMSVPPPWAAAPSTPWSSPPPWAVTASLPPPAAAQASAAEEPAAEEPSAKEPAQPDPPDDERS